MFLTPKTVEVDTAIFKKLRFKEYFGNLGKKKHQLNKLYSKRSNIDTTKIWLIHYIDSLPDRNKMYKESGLVIYDEEGKESYMSNSDYENLLDRPKYLLGLPTSPKKDPLMKKHKHVVSYEDYNKNLQKEIKKYKNYLNVSLYHFYNFNKGFPIEHIKGFWVKDENEIFKNSFSDGLFKYPYIIIYPNGDFYASHYFKRYSDEKKLFKQKRFEKSKKKWLSKMEKLN